MRYGKFVFLLILFLTVSSAMVRAQEKYTMESCIKYALDNSTTIKNAVVDEKIADAKVKETRGMGFPQIDASVSLQHDQKLSRFFGTYPDPSDPNSFSFFQNVDGAQPGDVLAGQNFFQLKNSGNAGVSISQLLFNGSYLVGLKASNAYRALTLKSTVQSEEQVIEAVKKAFYGALINQERISLFDSNIGRIDSLLRTTKSMFEAGFAEQIDVSRIQVNLNNLVTEREKFINLQALSLDLLKFQMNYPMDQEIMIEGDLDDITLTDELDSYYSNWDYSNRSDYQLLEANRNLQQLNIRNKYAVALPSLMAYGNLGYSTQSQSFGGLFKTESSVEDNGSIGPDKWYSFSNFGLRLSIPIFSGLQRTYVLQQEKLTLLKIENQYQTVKSGIDLEIRTAATTYKNSLKSLNSQKENTGLAENIAHVTKVKYEQGVGSNLEVVQAESDLKEAQVNYYNALYDAMIAKVDLEKAFGMLKKENAD